ncbi:MAG TPA: hypothetical protein VMF08_14345 [Candidatus Sulfotelmatobacter sp.]|nr:hypothetical protein [Candidatus Sulfotelmatobacter sp.]
MKYAPVVLAFLAGAVIASAVWGYYLVKCQVELATTTLELSAEQAHISERILNYLDNRNPIDARKLSFSATNHLEGFPSDVDYWDKRYPYMDIKRHFARTSESFQTFLQERQARLVTNCVVHTTQTNSALN